MASYNRPLTTGLKNKLKATFEIEQCWIFAVWWRPFWKWRPVRLWCPELIPDIENFLPVAIFKMAVTIPHKFNIVRFQRPELIPNIEKFLPVSIFKMANTIPQKFNMKCRWNRTMMKLCGIVAAILKMVTARNFSMSGINSGRHNLHTYQI
jgi:branched-subunit amino acid transport protein AzlD